MSAARRLGSAAMGAPATMKWAPTAAPAAPHTPVPTASCLTCPAAPRPARMGAPAAPRGRPPMSVPACQVGLFHVLQEWAPGEGGGDQEWGVWREPWVPCSRLGYPSGGGREARPPALLAPGLFWLGMWSAEMWSWARDSQAPSLCWASRTGMPSRGSPHGLPGGALPGLCGCVGVTLLQFSKTHI